MPLHDEVDFRLVDGGEPMAAVERPYRVPLQISKPERQPTSVRDGSTVGQDPGSQTLPPMGEEQVELIEAHIISKSCEGDGPGGLPFVHNPGEWRVPEPLLMEVSLEFLIPSLSHHDVWA